MENTNPPGGIEQSIQGAEVIDAVKAVNEASE